MQSDAPVCRKRRVNDQMMCAPCGLAWDCNDPEPPECGWGQGRDVRQESVGDFLRRVREELGG